jgi:mono/diheme cytochrome c family protein
MVQTKAMSRLTAVVSCLVVAIVSLTLAADGEAPPATGGPVLRFAETTHDFGTIRSDQKQTISWTYRNDGRAPLEIVNTAPSCGCTSAVQGESVAPGGTGSMTVTYDPAGQSGDVRKTLTVFTNDPVHPRTILTLRAKVVPNDEEPMPGGHPRFTGQSLLMGSCAGCHATTAQGKSGKELYGAVCAMCHGAAAEGGKAPGLRDPAYLASRDDKALAEAIAYGTANPKMPGFSDVMGGPLDAAQVASLVKLLRTWGPPPPSTPPAPSSPKR